MTTITTAASVAIHFLRSQAVRLSAGGFVLSMLLLLFLGIPAEAQGILLVGAVPLLLGGLVIAISAGDLTDWINKGEHTFQEKRAKAIAAQGRFARFFRRPFWSGNLKLWTTTSNVSDVHIRAGLRAAAALYFWGLMIVLLAITAYVTLAILLLLLMIVVAFKVWEFSQGNAGSSEASEPALKPVSDRTSTLYDKQGNRVGFERETTDIFGNPKIERFDKSWNKTGESRPTTGLLGDPKTEHFDRFGDKTGESRPTTDLLGGPKTEHFDRTGSKTGESRQTTDLFGNPKTVHYNREGDKSGETRD